MRNLLAILGLSFCLFACTNSITAVQQLQVDIADTNTIASGLQAEAALLVGNPAIPQATLAKVQGYLTVVQTDAAKLQAISTASLAQPIMQELETNANGIITALASVSGLPAKDVQILTAVEVLLPIVRASVGLITNTITTSAPGMSPDTARDILSKA